MGVILVKKDINFKQTKVRKSVKLQKHHIVGMERFCLKNGKMDQI